jgi:flagellin-like hook-associated protein FlgL
MALGVNWNSTAVLTHRNLLVSDRGLSASIERLSSGLRITKASDDPSSLVLANTMRYQVKGLEQATANAEEGITMIQTADAALDEMLSLLNNARGTALRAANDGINDTSQLGALQTELDEIIRSIDRIATDTRFGNKPLLDGSVGGVTLDRTTRTQFSRIDSDATKLPGGIQDRSAVGLLVPATGMTLTRDQVAARFSTAPSGTPAATLDTPLANLWQDPGGANQAQLTALPGSWTLTGPCLLYTSPSPRDH